jgi:hypothetical protein
VELRSQLLQSSEGEARDRWIGIVYLLVWFGVGKKKKQTETLLPPNPARASHFLLHIETFFGRT